MGSWYQTSTLIYRIPHSTIISMMDSCAPNMSLYYQYICSNKLLTHQNFNFQTMLSAKSVLLKLLKSKVLPSTLLPLLRTTFFCFGLLNIIYNAAAQRSYSVFFLTLAKNKNSCILDINRFTCMFCK